MCAVQGAAWGANRELTNNSVVPLSSKECSFQLLVLVLPPSNSLLWLSLVALINLVSSCSRQLFPVYKLGEFSRTLPAQHQTYKVSNLLENTAGKEPGIAGICGDSRWMLTLLCASWRWGNSFLTCQPYQLSIVIISMVVGVVFTVCPAAKWPMKSTSASLKWNC